MDASVAEGGKAIMLLRGTRGENRYGDWEPD